MLLRKRPKIQMIWPSAMGKSEAEAIKTNQRRKDQKTICRRGQVEAQVQIKSPLGYSMQAKDMLQLRLKRVSSRLWSPILWNGMVSSHLWSRIWYLLPDSSAAHYTADEATCLLWCTVASSRGIRFRRFHPSHQLESLCAVITYAWEENLDIDELFGGHCCGIHASRAPTAGAGRDDICNNHDLSWRYLVLEAEQHAKAEICLYECIDFSCI